MSRRCKTLWPTRKLACSSICRTCQMLDRFLVQAYLAAPLNQCSKEMHNTWTTLYSQSKSQWTLTRKSTQMNQKSKKPTRIYSNKTWIVTRSSQTSGDVMNCSSGKACCQSSYEEKTHKSWLSRKRTQRDSARPSSNSLTWEVYGKRLVYRRRSIQKAQLQITHQQWTRKIGETEA